MQRLTKTRIDIIEIMHAWARYRDDKSQNNGGWPRQVTLGKLLDGMPGTDCPRCKDAVTGASVGFIHIAAPGLALEKVECPVCHGARRAKLDASPSKANPVLIHGNGSRYGWNDDPISQKVDHIVCTKMSEDERVVVIQEFTKGGNQADKIRRLHLTQSTYRELLDDAIGIVAREIC
jgi:hypothetical protein